MSIFAPDQKCSQPDAPPHGHRAAAVVDISIEAAEACVDLLIDDIADNAGAMVVSLNVLLAMRDARDAQGMIYSARRARAYWRAIAGSARDLVEAEAATALRAQAAGGGEMKSKDPNDLALDGVYLPSITDADLGLPIEKAEPEGEAATAWAPSEPNGPAVNALPAPPLRGIILSKFKGVEVVGGFLSCRPWADHAPTKLPPLPPYPPTRARGLRLLGLGPRRKKEKLKMGIAESSKRRKGPTVQDLTI